MKLFSGKLLSVETGEYNSLVFATKKFDIGLGKFVDCSESVGISKECLHHVNSYKQHIGEVILVGINVFKTQKFLSSLFG